MCCSGVTKGVFGHVVLGIAMSKCLDAASKDIGARVRVTALVGCLGTDAELVGPLFAFGGMLSLASLDGNKSSVVGECKARECEEVADGNRQVSR